MSESKEVESNVPPRHVPLLNKEKVSQLTELSTGLNLNRSRDQIKFLNRVNESGVGSIAVNVITVDAMVEYLVEVADVKIGDIDPEIKLSPDCDPARRLHVARTQVIRHKAQGIGQPADVQASNNEVVLV